MARGSGPSRAAPPAAIAGRNTPAWYEYSTRNFTGWPDESNAWARPNNPAGIHERVKVLLSLTPVAK